MKDILVVGAGFAGAVYARELAEAGYRVTVIDKRSHIAGNAYDEVDETGTRRHIYGPHLFHTSNQPVVDWLSQFTEWVPYRHSVEALLPSGKTAPLPINRRTLEILFDVTLEDEAAVEAFLASLAEPISNPANAGETLRSKIGPQLTDLFFRPYTKKMWALDLEDMDASVVKRIPIRTDDNRDYFPDDTFQALPKDGYTAAFAKIFDHPNIEVRLNEAFDREMEGSFSYVFNSMPIDEYFGYAVGDLPYRSIRFHTTFEPSAEQTPGASVVNFTDTGKFTRKTFWRRLPAHAVGGDGQREPVTLEEPCDYKDNGLERYYPVKRADGASQALYEQYQGMANDIADKMQFIGRCGTYQYLDMHQVINQSLAGVRRWLAARS